MKRFISKPKVTTNEYNQKLITGIITLSKSTKLVNSRNNGKSPLDADWDSKNTEIYLKAGEIVNYQMQETHNGNSHTISFKVNDIIYTSTKGSK